MRTRLFFILFSFTALIACAGAHKAEDSCSGDWSFQKGLADAKSGKRMSSDAIVDSCAVDQRRVVEESYRAGYNSFDSLEAAADLKSDKTGSIKCKSKSDCPEGQWCRNRGDGVRLCLGNEPRGGFCGYDDDCAAGLCGKDDKKIGRCM